MEKTCPICGKPTNVYMGNARKDGLCREHGMKANKGEIEQCPDCGKWKDVFEQCKCKTKTETVAEKNTAPTTDKNKVVIINSENKSKCITCGKNTEGLLFCSQCYSKYKNKELLFKITNCSNVELLDENYEGRFVCKDGHIVKSKSEREIDNYLFENGISHAYEKALPYGATEKEILYPDFYLNDYLGKNKHVFIEHWGFNENNIQYTKTKKFKMQIYEKLGITLVCTYERSDTSDIDTALDRKLNKNYILENQINHKDE